MPYASRAKDVTQEVQKLDCIPTTAAPRCPPARAIISTSQPCAWLSMKKDNAALWKEAYGVVEKAQI